MSRRVGSGSVTCWRDAAPCIDLLPHPGRESRLRRRRGVALMLVSATVSSLGVWGGRVYLDKRIAAQGAAHAALEHSAEGLRARAMQARRLVDEVRALQDRLAALARLDESRVRSAGWLDVLARRMPADVYLTRAEQDSEAIAMTGVAASEHAVGDLLARFATVPGVGGAQLLSSRHENDTAAQVAFRIGAAYSLSIAGVDGEAAGVPRPAP